MKLTKVEADSYPEALRKIRHALGDEAMIVGTRSFRRGGVLGVGGREVVEVYVADPRPPRRGSGSGSGSGTGSGTGTEGMESLSREVGEIKKELRELSRERSELPDDPFVRDAHALLVELEVAPRLRTWMVKELEALPLPSGLPDPSRVRSVVGAQLRKLFLPGVPLPAAQPPRTVVLIGPTGVGKTTTVAKLAARAKLSGGEKVGLVTLDTFRIAGVDQLRTYAEIIGVPLKVAADPVELARAVESFREDGTAAVFIDSAGRSQRDELKMNELREFLGALPGAEVHLVLSATTHASTLRNVAQRFRGAGFHRVILTKLDETACFGAVLEPLCEIGKPVSYLTDGQNVPDDLMPSDPERLAEMVLRKSSE